MESLVVIPQTLYFATYIALADNRLYDKEWHRIEGLLQSQGFDEEVRNNVLSIIMDRADKITLEETVEELKNMPMIVREAAVSMGLQIAYEDGNFGEKENVAFQGIRTQLGIEKKRFEVLCKTAEMIAQGTQDDMKEDRIIIRSKSLYERYEHCLLSADLYSNVIKEMAVIAKEDIAYTTKKVEEIEQEYRVYPQQLKKKTNKILATQSHKNNDDERKQLQTTFNDLLETINNCVNNAEENMSVLRERQAVASESFTISFMGRTKAGKSTLHSVLLGGLNSDFIGRGAERTTRYNYIYDFQGMRIIDTPGIGAPGGKNDTEIAKEVADESDLICYVVTTDSIQETEFDFLRHLKERNKPVIILLNKKDNFVRSEKKYQAFLDNPLDWYDRDGEDAIQGHIDRINTYVSLNHDFHNYSIVPVHLLAAKLALKETELKKKEKLLLGSRINVFLKKLSDRISSNGKIQRSQTIYNSAIYHLEEDKKALQDQSKSISCLRDEIKNTSDEALNKIRRYGETKRNDFITSFNSTFDAFLKEDVRKFANEHFDTDKKQLNEEWKLFLAQGDLEKKLELSYSGHWELYQRKVQDILLDAEEDLKFNLEFGNLSNVHVIKIGEGKFIVQLLGVLTSLVGAFLALSNPVMWIISGVSVLATLIGGFFMKSKDQLIDAAKGNLYDLLVENVNRMREMNLETLLKKYDNARKNICEQFDSFNKVLCSSLSTIHQDLENLCEHISETEKELNKSYGARIANYMMNTDFYRINEPKTMLELVVKRVYKQHIQLLDKRLYIQPMYVPKEDAEDILQERLYMNEEVE